MLHNDDLKFHVDTLRGGGVVALPTETVYGLACLALNKTSVQKVFKIKGRPTSNPLIVHVLDFEQAEAISFTNEIAKELAKLFWPGPLTMILPKKPIVPREVTAGLESVAIRSPSHSLFRKVLELTGEPLAAPSANPHSKLSPTTADEVLQAFGKNCPPILDGGKCAFGLESTVLDLTSNIPTILRPGPIAEKELGDFLGAEIKPSSFPTFARGARKSPGLHPKHYAPETPIRLYQNLNSLVKLAPRSKRDVIILPSRKSLPKFGANGSELFVLSNDGNVNEIGQNLYGTLRKADKLHRDKIHISLLDESNGMARAVNDRLRRASF